MRRLALFFVCLGILSAVPAKAAPLALDGAWVVLDENMSAGDFFTGPWTFNNAAPVTFKITDLFVVGDQFEVYDNGGLVLTTPAVLDWTAYGATPFDEPPFTTDPDTAFGAAEFSKGTLVFAPGAHSITIRDLVIPPNVIGGPFPDGTVAFSAVEAPEPVTLSLLGLGLSAAALRRRRRSTI